LVCIDRVIRCQCQSARYVGTTARSWLLPGRRSRGRRTSLDRPDPLLHSPHLVAG